MIYKLYIEPAVVDYLEKLHPYISKRIMNKLRDSKENPHHFFVRLKGRIDYRMRVGDYRMIADIDEKLKIIHVTLIGHRKNIYD